MNWMIPPVYSAVFDYLLRFSLIFLAAWLAGNYVLQHKHPMWRVQCLRISLVGIVLLPLVQWLSPGVPLLSGHSHRPTFDLNQDTQTPIGSATVPDVEPFADDTTTGFQDQSGVTGKRQDPSKGASRLSAHSLFGIMTCWWALITAMYTFRMWRSRRQVLSILHSTCSAPDFLVAKMKTLQCRMGISRSVTLRFSDALNSPFVYGLRKPVIVLPVCMLKTNNPSDFSAVLVHELAHIQSKDLWWMNAFRWMKVAFWFHPLAWMVAAKHELSCEENSDQTAIHTLRDPASYTRSLARLVIQLKDQRPLPAGIAMARRSQIRYRLDQLQHAAYAEGSRRSYFAFLFCTIFVVFSISGFKQVEAKAHTVQDVLQKLVEHRDKFTDFYMDIHMQETNCEVDANQVKDKVIENIFEHKYYKQGKRYSIETEGKHKNPGETEYKFQYSGKAIGGTGEQIILDTHQNKISGKPIYVVSEKETKYTHVHYLYIEYGLALGGDNNLSWLAFVNESNATLETEEMDGVECLKIASVNDNGRYEIWIDPTAGYNIRMARSTKKKGDLYSEQPFRMAFAWRKEVPVRCESIYKADRIEKIGDHYVITQDHFVEKIINKDGSCHEYRVEKTRSNIQFHPDFEGMKAFELDIPNGTPVTEYVIDDNRKYGGTISSRPVKGKFLWKDGKVVPVNHQN